MAKIRIRTHANPLSYPKPIKREEWESILDTEQTHICLDMGCGQGDFIVESARRYPEKRYVGIEVRKMMCNKVNHKIKEAGLSNAICVHGNASISLKTMFYTSEVDEVVINFPDPWFKEKHKKRQMIQEAVVNDLYEILTEQGTIYVQTDVQEVFDTFKAELMKRFKPVPYREREEKSYWEKHLSRIEDSWSRKRHEEKGTKIHRSCFVKG